MVGMLASVKDLSEAEIALQANVDVIDLKDPSKGALGAVDEAVAREVVESVAAHCLVSATIGDLPMQAELINQAISVVAGTGVDVIKVGVFGEITDSVLEVLKKHVIDGVQAVDGKRFFLVLVCFVDHGIEAELQQLPVFASTGIRGVMLDTAEKHAGNLCDYMTDQQLYASIREVQSYGLLAGLAGSLRGGDISRLLPLQPDYMGFRGALCHDNLRVQTLDFLRVQQICALVHEKRGGSDDTVAREREKFSI